MKLTIELIEINEAHKSAVRLGKMAARSGKSALEAMLEVSIPNEWPQFPEAFEPSGPNSPLFSGWPSYFFICPSEHYLVGNGGFAGPPDACGHVEIGYEIAPQFQNRGFGTAAATRLLEIAFSRPEVTAVVAQTLGVENASNAVLRKVGMTYVKELTDPEMGSLWLWRIARDAFTH